MTTTQNQGLSPAADSKGCYEGEMEHKLREIGKSIDNFIENSDESKEQFIKSLKEKRAKAEDKLHDLKTSGAEAWSELKQGMDRAWEELSLAFCEIKDASGKAVGKFNKNCEQEDSSQSDGTSSCCG